MAHIPSTAGVEPFVLDDLIGIAPLGEEFGA
jgi:hypothetical protein